MDQARNDLDCSIISGLCGVVDVRSIKPRSGDAKVEGLDKCARRPVGKTNADQIDLNSGDLLTLDDVNRRHCCVFVSSVPSDGLEAGEVESTKDVGRAENVYVLWFDAKEEVTHRAPGDNRSMGHLS